MKKLILLLALASVTVEAMAAPDMGCDSACARNVHAVFNSQTSYTMKIDDSAHAHISVTWTSKHQHGLKPVTMVGVAPVRLRHTVLNEVELADAGNDPCRAVITILEQRGDNVDVYQVPVHNVQCY